MGHRARSVGFCCSDVSWKDRHIYGTLTSRTSWTEALEFVDCEYVLRYLVPSLFGLWYYFWCRQRNARIYRRRVTASLLQVGHISVIVRLMSNETTMKVSTFCCRVTARRRCSSFVPCTATETTPPQSGNALTALQGEVNVSLGPMHSTECESTDLTRLSQESESNGPSREGRRA